MPWQPTSVFLPFPAKTVFLNRVSNLTYPNGLFNPFSYNDQVSEMLREASNQVFKVRGLESVDKQVDYLLFQQRRINMCGSLTPSLGVFPYGLLVVLLHSLQA